jgi:hypothetical protein
MELSAGRACWRDCRGFSGVYRAEKVGDNGSTLELRIKLGAERHAHVAGQGVGPERRRHVDGLVPLELLEGIWVVIEEFEAHVAAVRDNDGVGLGSRARIICTAVVFHELSMRSGAGTVDARVQACRGSPTEGLAQSPTEVHSISRHGVTNRSSQH